MKTVKEKVVLYLQKFPSISSFLCADKEYIVSTNKSIAIFILELAITIFFGLLQSNVHVAIKACQDSLKELYREFSLHEKFNHAFDNVYLDNRLHYWV